MSLSTEQMELLHAWVDGETTVAEAAIATELVARNEAARIYVTELKRLRELVAQHACITAPPGLHDRVCTALKNELSAPVIPFPRSVWRLALVGAAALVVLSVALVYGPRLGTDKPAPSHVASTVVDDAKTPKATGPGSEPFGGTFDRGRTGESPKDGHWSESPLEGTPVPPPANENPVKDLDHYDAPNQPQDRAQTLGVLSLDRGVDQAFELSVNLNRERSGSVFQVCNDMLIVSSLYGDAKITAHETEKSVDDFSGTDFSDVDGVEVELDSDQVGELLAAIGRLAAQQQYGEVIVPTDLRKSIKSTNAAVDELQEISNQLEDVRRKGSTKQPALTDAEREIHGARAYLPPSVQRECARNDADALGSDDKHSDVREVLRALDTQRAAMGAVAQTKETNGKLEESRKIKLVIRLR